MPSKIRQAVSKEFETQAPTVESYMKANAPWNDQTGAARAGLRAEFIGDRHVERLAIRMFHGVSYGIFLETRNAGKYAIIAPTLLDEGDRIMGEMRGLLNRITGEASSFMAGGSPLQGISL
jgi:hypothetical protein